MTTETLSYANDALAEARLRIVKEMPEGTPIDAEAEYLIEARATDTAVFSLATQYGSLVKSILYLMYKMELNQFYRVLDQEYETLREWVKFRFEKLFEAGLISEDYMMRYVSTVENMLIPQFYAHLTGKSDISPQQIIENASEAQLKETPYYYQSAKPEQQAELIEVLATPAATVGDRKEKRAQIDQIKQTIRRGNGIVPITLYAETASDGRYNLHGLITHDDLNFLMNLLGKRLDLHLAGA